MGHRSSRRGWTQSLTWPVIFVMPQYLKKKRRKKKNEETLTTAQKFKGDAIYLERIKIIINK